MRTYLPLVHAVLTELGERLPVDVDRQEVLSVGTMALARAQFDFVDCGLTSFEDHARDLIRRALQSEFLRPSEVDAEPVPAAPPPAEADEVDLTGCKILLVEDSTMIRKKLRFLLEKARYEVFEAKSGEEALWLAQEVVPDLILLDVIMDKMDGFETCARLKSVEGFADIPVVFLTGKTETEFIARGFDAGASDYIGKPFNPKEAMPRIRTHLKIRLLTAFRQRNIDELETLNKAKDKLLRMASHDLRNPLSAIHGLADMLKDQEMCGPLSENQGQMVETIHGAAESMLQMLGDLLDLSSLESKDVRLGVTEADPTALCASLVNLFRVSASRKEIDLVFAPVDSVGTVEMDEQKVRRVLENFLSNAIKFSPKGTQVRLVLSQMGSTCRFEVEDEGPGVKSDEQKMLFKEFGRTSNQPTAGEKSTGLGLSICRGIAEAHGGSVSMSNRKDRGSCFRLELPVRAGAGTTATRSSSLRRQGPPTTGTPSLFR
ncbi:MAG: response regulator [Opitutales bacterium]